MDIFITRAQYDYLISEKKPVLERVLRTGKNKRWSLAGLSMTIPESEYPDVKSYVKVWDGEHYSETVTRTEEATDHADVYAELMRVVKAVVESGNLVNPVLDTDLRNAYLAAGGKLGRRRKRC